MLFNLGVRDLFLNEDEPHLEPFSKEYEQGIEFLKNHKIELEMTNKLCFKIHNKIRGVNL